MMADKVDVDLTGVPQTLLLPLIGRAIFSQTPYSPIHDERAVKLTQTLNYDFDALLKRIGNAPTLWWIARAYHFDEAIKAFLKLHPRATIVNLGAGLETAFYRVDNGSLTWIDLDLPEVIELRKKLLPIPNNRVHYLAKSALDYAWMEDVKQYGNDVFFFAGGFFMYFQEEQVKSLFIHMADQFPNAHVIFDALQKRVLDYANIMLKKAAMEGAVLKWSIEDGREMEKWSPKIKLVSQFPYFKDIKTHYAFPLITKMKMFFYDYFDRHGIIHLRFS